MFKVGHFVIHPRHGAGKIIEITERELPTKTFNYYVVNPLLKEITIKLPYEGVEKIGVRHPMPEDKIQEHLSILCQPYYQEKYLRSSKIAPLLDLNDPEQVLSVIRDLFYEKIKRQREGKSLSLTKKRMYALAISLIASEIVASCRCELGEARFIVRKSLAFKPAEKK